MKNVLAKEIIPSLEIGSPMKKLAKNISAKYTHEYLIKQHNIISHYIPFLKRELQEKVIEISELLEKRHDVKIVDIIVGELPEGEIGKRFAKLSDVYTNRKYDIGKPTIMNAIEEYRLIEIERK